MCGNELVIYDFLYLDFIFFHFPNQRISAYTKCVRSIFLIVPAILLKLFQLMLFPEFSGLPKLRRFR